MGGLAIGLRSGWLTNHAVNLGTSIDSLEDIRKVEVKAMGILRTSTSHPLAWSQLYSGLP